MVAQYYGKQHHAQSSLLTVYALVILTGNRAVIRFTHIGKHVTKILTKGCG